MKKNAFTLIELSIVLVIIGLIIGGSFKVLKTMRENAKITNAKNDVEAAKNAVVGNTILNRNTLPDQTFFHKNLSPVKNNQHPLLYEYATDLDKNNICSLTSTDLTVKKYKWNNTKTAEELDRTIQNIAFVIASRSLDNYMQTEKLNNNVDYHAPFIKIGNHHYDDMVEWVTLGELKSQLNCVKTGLKILNDHNLIDGILSQKYGTNEIFADGGTVTSNSNKYKWCTEYSAGDNPNSWLQQRCDTTAQSDLVSTCTASNFKSCNHFYIEGKTGTTLLTASQHQITIYIKDDADTDVSKKFIIKIK